MKYVMRLMRDGQFVVFLNIDSALQAQCPRRAEIMLQYGPAVNANTSSVVYRTSWVH